MITKTQILGKTRVHKKKKKIQPTSQKEDP